MRDKHQIIEEPCEVKVSSTVLKTNGVGDNFVEFNTFKGFQDLREALDQMGEPTDQQAALIRATMQGKRLEYPHRYDQEALLNLHKAKMHLEVALDLLNM